MTLVDILLGKKNDCQDRARLRMQKGVLAEKISYLRMSLENGSDKVVPIGQEWQEVLSDVFIKELTPQIPHETTTVTFVNAKRGAETQLHRHDQIELVHLLSGKVQERGSGNIYDKVGSFFEVPKGDLHGLTFMEDTLLIIQWIPKLQ